MLGRLLQEYDKKMSKLDKLARDQDYYLPLGFGFLDFWAFWTFWTNVRFFSCGT